MNMKHTNVAYTLWGDTLAMLQYNELLVDKTTMTKLFTLHSGIFVRDIEVELWFFIWNVDNHSFSAFLCVHAQFKPAGRLA